MQNTALLNFKQIPSESNQIRPGKPDPCDSEESIARALDRRYQDIKSQVLPNFWDSTKMVLNTVLQNTRKSGNQYCCRKQICIEVLVKDVLFCNQGETKSAFDDSNDLVIHMLPSTSCCIAGNLKNMKSMSTVLCLRPKSGELRTQRLGGKVLH